MKQKVVFITGASSGFGKAIALHLASKGYKVYGTSRKIVEVAGVNMLQMDVTKPETITQAVSSIIQREQKIDVVINNAGVGISGALELATPQEIEWQMETNFMGVVRVVQVVLPYLRAQHGGLIINMSSIGGVMGLPYQGFYAASKFAVEGFSESLSLEVKPLGIKVVLVEPGDFATGFTASRQISEATAQSAAYRDSFVRTMKAIEKDELGGLKPSVLADKIEQIIESKHPSFRYVVANIEQRFSVVLKKLIPYSLFRMILNDYYKV